jgi:hypothetical protein
MKITSLRVEPHDFDKPITGDAVSNNAEDYVSERVKPYVVDLIDDEGTYFYRSNGTTIEITADEYANVLVNPRLYYFSSALKLQMRAQRASLQRLGRNWPSELAAPLGI